MYILTKSNKKMSSRKQIDIEGVSSSVLILPGKQYRSVLKIGSINFELKSETEQDAIIDSYQSFLNSLPFPVQIIVRIREMNLDSYIEGFKKRLAGEKEVIYKDQIEDYTMFVKSLVESNKILTRNFYIIIPLDEQLSNFEVVKEQMSLQIEIISKSLARMGMQSTRLDNLGLLDLFYNFYSSDNSKSQPLNTKQINNLGENSI